MEYEVHVYNQIQIPKVSQEHVNNLKIYEGKVDSKGQFFENC